MRKLLFILTSCIALHSSAQDVHFTQYYTSPLTLNPANTGLVSCDWRLAGNYRNQWSAVNSTPYLTGSISYDMATLRSKLNGGSLGIGVLGYFDKSGTGALQQITSGLSVAYHLPLGGSEEFKPSTLSIGAQGYLVQKSIDFTKLKFENMYDPVTGQLLYSSGENQSQADLTYPDFNAGIMYSGYINSKTSIYGGASMYHITRPVETFLNGTNKINSRVTATLGSSMQMNDNLMVYLSGLYQQQGKATELLLGGAVGFILNPQHEEEEKSSVFYIGTWYRYGDAVSPYIGFEWAKAKLGLSYDVNLSSFSTATKGQGGLEISLIYNGCIIRNETRTFNFACPRF